MWHLLLQRLFNRITHHNRNMKTSATLKTAESWNQLIHRRLVKISSYGRNRFHVKIQKGPARGQSKAEGVGLGPIGLKRRGVKGRGGFEQGRPVRALCDA